MRERETILPYLHFPFPRIYSAAVMLSFLVLIVFLYHPNNNQSSTRAHRLAHVRYLIKDCTYTSKHWLLIVIGKFIRTTRVRPYNKQIVLLKLITIIFL